jgi:hypothetical protein
MLSWPALLVAPLVVLGQLSIAYSLVAPQCAQQGRGWLHAVSLVSLALVLAMTGLAWRAWQAHARAIDGAHPPTSSTGAVRAVSAASGDAAAQRPSFVALVAVLVGALSTLVSVALWLPIWMLSPCL